MNFNICNAQCYRTLSNTLYYSVMKPIIHKRQRLLIPNIITAQYHGFDFQQPINRRAFA